MDKLKDFMNDYPQKLQLYIENKNSATITKQNGLSPL